MSNPRPRSVGFVVVDIHSGEVLSPLLPTRAKAHAAVSASYTRAGLIPDRLGRFHPDDVRKNALRFLGVHQVKLYPGETFNPSDRR